MSTQILKDINLTNSAGQTAGRDKTVLQIAWFFCWEKHVDHCCVPSKLYKALRQLLVASYNKL